MPLIDRNPRRVFDEFEEHLTRVVRETLPMPAGVRLTLVTKHESDSAILQFMRGNAATAIDLDTNVGRLWLSINQELKAVREQKRRFRLRTLKYGYRLSESLDGAALLRWEYDSSTADEAHCRHHSHARGAIPVGGQALNLDRLHIPTGWVLIEHVIRFLLRDLEVAPRTADWAARLRASETRFHEQFTSKGYKFPFT